MTAPFPNSQINQGANPYVGPRTFETADRQRYFGREAEAASLLGRVISERLLLFYAQSGAGKSSLINARLIPGLREEEGFSVLPVARVAGALPASVAQVDNIFLFNLMASLDRAAGNPGQFARLGLTGFLEHLVTEDGVAWRYDPAAGAEEAPPAADDELAAAPAGRFALIVDQFEEIITAHPERWGEREEFFRQLDAALQTNPNLWIVLSLREDYVAALDPYAPLVFNRLRARFYMERMGVDAGLEAVRRPAELAGRPFAAGVAEQLVDNLRQVRVPGQETTVPGQYVEPVQLQVVCYQLWEGLAEVGGQRSEVGGQRSGARDITFEDLAVAGDVDRALTQFYEETLGLALADPAAAGVSERRVRAWFDAELITEAGRRGLVHQGEVETAGLPNAVVRALQRRFLVRGEARGGDTWLELVHDRFVEPIRRSNREWFGRNLNPLTLAAQEWQAAGKPDGKLYSGSQLAAAAAQLAASPADFGDLERDFVEAGQQVETRRAARRQRAIAWGAAALSLVFIAVAAWALRSGGEARTEATRALNAEATANAERGIAQENANLAATREVEAQVAEAKAVAEATRALNAEATANAERGIAQENANLAATREAEAQVAEATAVAAQAQALAAKAETERLLRGIRADQLTANALRVLDKDETLALLLAVEGLRAQSDFTTTEVITTPIFPKSTTLVTRSIMVNETVVASAVTNVYEILGRTEGTPLAIYVNGRFGSFSPDGRWLVSTSWDYTSSDYRFHLWDLADPSSEPRTLTSQKGVIRSMALSPDGRWLASGSDDHIVRLWNLATPSAEPHMLDGHEGGVTDLAFSPDGRWLASGSDDHIVRLWNLATPSAEPHMLDGHEGGVTDLAFSPDGRWLASGSDDHTVRLWNLATPPIFAGHEVAVQHLAPSPLSMAFSPDSRWLATSSDDHSAFLWDLANPNAQPNILTGHEDAVSSVAFSPDSQWLATVTAYDAVRLWKLANPNAAPRIIKGRVISILIQGLRPLSMAFSPDGRWLATTTSDDNTVSLWDLADPNSDPRILAGHEDHVKSLAFTVDGRWLTTISDDNTVRLWTWRVKDLMTLACTIVRRNLGEVEWQRYFRGTPYRRTCPQWPMHASFTKALRDEAITLAYKGDVAGALTRWDEALTLDPGLDANPEVAYDWNALCRRGAHWGQAAPVLDACETAVKLVPDDGGIRDSRGLARALTGDVPGAIADFEFALKWAQETRYGEKFIASRTAWLAALRAGKAPADIFDAATLARLRGE